jgi:hypothetical protein
MYCCICDTIDCYHQHPNPQGHGGFTATQMNELRVAQMMTEVKHAQYQAELKENRKASQIALEAQMGAKIQEVKDLYERYFPEKITQPDKRLLLRSNK